MGVTEIMAGIKAVQEAIDVGDLKPITLYDEPPANSMVYPCFINVEQREDVVRGMGLRQRDMYFGMHLLFAAGSQKYAVKHRRQYVDAVLDTFDASGVLLGGQVTQAWIDSIEDDPVQLGDHQYVAATFNLRVEQKQAFDFGSDLIPAIGGNCVEPIFATADELNETTDFTNSDYLQIPVVQGKVYVGRLTLIVISDNDGSNATARFESPDGVETVWSPLSDGFSDQTVQAYLEGSGAEVPLNDLDTEMRALICPLRIDCTSMVAVTGEVVFQFRNPDGNGSGGVTVKQGSFIEVWEVA